MKQTITLVLSTLLYVLIGFFTCNTEALECLQCFYTSKDLISNHPDVANCLNNPNQTIGNEVTLQESFSSNVMIKSDAIISLNYCNDFIGFDGDDYVRKRRKNESIRHSIPHHVLILVEYLLLFYIIFLSQNQLESNY
ncbi:unnamed protein product [Allacma fusca]|uniref:Uncharacterized protein n=1 Tax=Allacma fusca TaxID=39272 RepID=A0A8J2KKV4_9HEXA|nr:unnamed protein product [Allacma fusca]